MYLLGSLIHVYRFRPLVKTSSDQVIFLKAVTALVCLSLVMGPMNPHCWFPFAANVSLFGVVWQGTRELLLLLPRALFVI